MVKKSGKKLITVLFIVAIIISVVIPLSNSGTVSASASSYSCTSTKLQGLINKYTGTYWNGVYNNAYQCKGFADMMFNAMYGTGGVGRYNSGSYHYYVPTPREAVELARTSSASYDDIYDMMHKAKSGDYIQWSRGYSQHSAIFVSCDKEGFYIFDCNYISPNLCGVHYVTFAKLARTNYGVSVYRSNQMERELKQEAAEAALKAAQAEKKKRLEERMEAEAARQAEEQRRIQMFGFSEEEITLYYEDTAELKVNYAREIVSWTSSDTTAVVVNDLGKITAVGPGKSTITILDIDGLTDTCVVTVDCTKYKNVIEGFRNGFDVNTVAIDGAMNGLPDSEPSLINK